MGIVGVRKAGRFMVVYRSDCAMANINTDTFGPVFGAMFSDEKHGGGSESGEAGQRPNTSPRVPIPSTIPTNFL
jgi:hypothetical protein